MDDLLEDDGKMYKPGDKFKKFFKENDKNSNSHETCCCLLNFSLVGYTLGKDSLSRNCISKLKLLVCFYWLQIDYSKQTSS